MKKVKATHYICIKSKPSKEGASTTDKLILRAGEIRELKEADCKLLEAEAVGRWVEVADGQK